MMARSQGSLSKNYYLNTSAAILLTFVAMLAEGQKIDSLESLLPQQHGLARARTLYELAYEHIDVDNQLAKEYASKAYYMAKAYGDSLLIVKSGRIGALALGRLDEQDSSVIVSLQILPIERRNSFEKELIQTLNRLGIGYSHKGKYDSALIYHFESLSLREKKGDPVEIRVALENIASVYFILQDYDKALSFYNRCYDYAMGMANKDELDNLLLNISVCYIYKNQIDIARNYIDRALELCKEDCAPSILMVAKLQFGLISTQRKEYDSAKEYFLESYALACQLKNLRYKLDNVANLLEIAGMAGILQRNDKLFEQAEILLEEDRNSHRQTTTNMYHVLFESYQRLRDFEKMSFYQNKYIQLKDSIYNEGLTTNLMRVEAGYLERENKAKIEAQAKVLVLTNDIIDRQKTTNLIIGILAALFFGFVILLIEVLKQKKQANALLEKKVFERTIELVTQHNLMQKAMQEREIQVDRMANEIRSSLATIRGLGLLVLHDVNARNASTYINKIEQTSNELLETIDLTKRMVN